MAGSPTIDSVAPLADGAPFSHRNVPSAADRAAFGERLAAAGIRELPYPFGSLLSIVSDVDFSTVDRYRLYRDTLVAELGLDFGDSAYLHWTRGGDGRGPADVMEPQGLGFLAPSLRARDDEAAPPLRFGLGDMVAEYLRGNIDHLHGPLARGPRFARVTATVDTEGPIVVDLPPPAETGHFAVGESDVQAIALIGPAGTVADAGPVIVHDRAGGATRFEPDTRSRGRLAPDGWTERRFVCPADAAPPALAETVRVEADRCRPGPIAIMLLSTTGDLLLDALRRLATAGVSPNLVTEHFGVYFFNEPSLRPRVERLAAAITTASPRLQAFYGAIDDGVVRCSTLGDDPGSFACVMPELTREIGVRFINPAGLTAAPGGRFDLLDVISPAATRAGNAVYVMRRILPPISDRHPLAQRPDDEPMVRKSRVDSFGARLLSVLDACDHRPGGVHPIYTHIGAVTEGCPTPEPYLEPEPLRMLQDRVLGISGAVEPSGRIWFTRASTMCDYALLLRSLADATHRADGDTIEIRRWRDPVLDEPLPDHPEQLYGATWYVDDAGRASVSLDGEPIHALARNPPDATGRPSVTVAACGIRHAVIGDADPSRARPQVVTAIDRQDASWTWHDDGGFGSLRIDAGATRGSVRLAVADLDPIGCQHFLCAVRADSSEVSLAFEVETVGDGRFLFGDAEIDRPITARYRFPRGLLEAGRWRTTVTPFCDLTWIDRTTRPTPLPSHPTRSITVHLAGPGPAGVDLRRMHFGRPRTHGPATDPAPRA